MPISFTPDLIPRFDKTFLNYVNTNMQRLKQSLQHVALETISTVAPLTPYTGQRYTNPTAGIDYIWNGTAWIPTSHWGAFTTYDPVWTQTATITYTKTYCGFTKEGFQVAGSMHLIATSSGTGANIVQAVSTPFTATVASNRSIGSGFFYDASLNVRTGLDVILNTTTSFKFVTVDASYVDVLGGPASGNPNQVVSTDVLSFNYRFESTT